MSEKTYINQCGSCEQYVWKYSSSGKLLHLGGSCKVKPCSVIRRIPRTNDFYYTKYSNIRHASDKACKFYKLLEVNNDNK